LEQESQLDHWAEWHLEWELQLDQWAEQLRKWELQFDHHGWERINLSCSSRNEELVTPDPMASTHSNPWPHILALHWHPSCCCRERWHLVHSLSSTHCLVAPQHPNLGSCFVVWPSSRHSSTVATHQQQHWQLPSLHVALCQLEWAVSVHLCAATCFQNVTSSCSWPPWGTNS